ncbi:MAG: ribbon-helix-helix protein, CopG family [Coriobacteriales bacterium]|jgi:hypothetical protein|nr:ribbon-helix-helix protein, CopG family [Coriobacteriales bacterium]
MNVQTKNGVLLTEEMIEELAAAYESGDWPGVATGEIVMGRPRLAEEEVRTVTFKLPVSKIVALDKKAKSRTATRSEALREAVDGYLL